MPKITALLHCHGNAEQLARTLETLRPCDEVLLVNHGADPEVEKIGRQHGATIKVGVPGVSPGAYLVDAANDWIFCMRESESLSDGLEASLFEWKQREHQPSQMFAVTVRRQHDGQWRSEGQHTRLVNRTCVNWLDELPHDEEKSELLEGDLLRIDDSNSAAA